MTGFKWNNFQPAMTLAPQANEIRPLIIIWEAVSRQVHEQLLGLSQRLRFSYFPLHSLRLQEEHLTIFQVYKKNS